MASPHVGAVGLPIEVDVVDDEGQAIDLTTASVKKIRLKKPGEASALKEATLVGANRLRYVTADGDLDAAGEYRYQAYVEMAGWKDHSESAGFEVLRVE